MCLCRADKARRKHDRRSGQFGCGHTFLLPLIVPLMVFGTAKGCASPYFPLTKAITVPHPTPLIILRFFKTTQHKVRHMPHAPREMPHFYFAAPACFVYLFDYSTNIYLDRFLPLLWSTSTIIKSHDFIPPLECSKAGQYTSAWRRQPRFPPVLPDVPATLAKHRALSGG